MHFTPKCEFPIDEHHFSLFISQYYLYIKWIQTIKQYNPGIYGTRSKVDISSLKEAFVGRAK